MDAAQIVDVVSDFVTLRKRGINYVGLCPFHDDRTPSFSVSPAKGLFKCFACGKGGNAVHFIMEHEQMTFPEALRYLAKKYGIEIQERELTDAEKLAQSERESLFVVNNFARDYFQNLLHNDIDGKAIGLAYFRQRGFREDIIEKFQLGYAKEAYDAFAKEALKKGYKQEFLVKTGLCYETDEHKLHDRFWGRVIFPVHTLSGKVVAFGGRVLSSQTKGVKMKYVNSPESVIYNKSRELYGIYFAKSAIVKQDRCFLVEGYTDVISMHQSGVENVVASSGTALTHEQIQLIHRFTNNITVLYDGDAAGIHASLRGIDMLLEQGMNIKVCLLPDGDDPDSFARKHHSDDFRKFIEEHENDFIRFKANLLMEEAGKDPIKRATLIGDIVQSISVIPEPIVRDVYIKECAQLLKLEDKLLVQEVAKRRERAAEKKKAPFSNTTSQPIDAAPQSGAPLPEEKKEEGEKTNTPGYRSSISQEERENSPFYTFERQIIQMIVRYGEKELYKEKLADGSPHSVSVTEFVVKELQEDELSFHNPLHQHILKEAFAHIHEAGFIAQHFFINHIDPEISKLASDLATDRYQLSKVHTKYQNIAQDKDRLMDIVPTLVISFKNAIVNDELRHLLQKLNDPSLATDNVRCEELMKQYKDMKEVEKAMAKRLGERVVLK